MSPLWVSAAIAVVAIVVAMLAARGAASKADVDRVASEARSRAEQLAELQQCRDEVVYWKSRAATLEDMNRALLRRRTEDE